MMTEANESNSKRHHPNALSVQSGISSNVSPPKTSNEYFSRNEGKDNMAHPSMLFVVLTL
jgi:hypothetical protein